METLYSTSMYCTKKPSDRLSAGIIYDNFATDARTTRCYDSKSPLLNVVVEECEESPDCYWGWWEYDFDWIKGERVANSTKGEFVFVYYHKGLVEMCFPYGSKAEEERGRGKLLPVRIIEKEVTS